MVYKKKEKKKRKKVYVCLLLDISSLLYLPGNIYLSFFCGFSSSALQCRSSTEILPRPLGYLL